MSARLLALDTTAEFGSIALAEGDHVLEELILHSPDGFAHLLFGHIARLLARHGWDVQDVDCFAGAAGPGSFTGVRVGLTAVKGLAEATGRPAIAVSNLQAIASFGSGELRAPVLDARRGEVYGGLYNQDLKAVQPETVSSFSNWLQSLPDAPVEFLSPDFSPFRHAIASTRFANAEVRETPRALAGAIAQIAAARLSSGQGADPAAIDANYVRRSDAELFWKDR
ncbi:MAG: tRNA (adenosine(37)-N6)-threonylcarbamoyltransferase complex dimerization subunit type 1 TsaB [Bryobacteraceae bacterium]|nr:tRNA (adenosine(37)-N6)-threonylcarbamoyltransferase complex dimerization subunit type 1 TsaB [Bryobacteraceae bacterium]